LKHAEFHDKKTTEAVPIKPIFVKSYDGLMPDYYIVPFVQDHKFVNITIVRTMPVSKAFITEAGLPTPPDKLLEVDASEAVAIMKEAKGVNNVPNPRLILYREPSSSTEYTREFSLKAYLELYWEFTFADKTRSYVTQSKQVVTKDIAPWYETYVAPKYDPKEVKLEPNKLTRYDGWSLNVQSIVFGQSFPNDPTLKTATISFTIQNNAGDDQIFMPKGSIVGITGTGGKTYPMTFGSLDLQYIQSQKMRIEQKQTGIKPGLLKLASAISVDSAETRFSKVTYRDEQGNEFEIPVDMTPELKINPPKINGTMEPYNIQSKDWSLAITQLQFRHSIENKFILAALAFNLTNNSGVDTIFSPKGKILGITGTSGKFYPYDGPNTLEQDYAGLLEQKKVRAKETGQLYQPGVLTLYPEILINVGEKNLSKILYQDENGKKFEIPVSGISPVSK